MHYDCSSASGGTLNCSTGYDRRFLVADERGSAIAETDNSGNVISQNTYDEYGVPGSANSGRFGYAGRPYLYVSGLYDNRARAYNPRLGRFMQTDPIGQAGGLNIYNYTGGDPVNFTDPFGLRHQPQCPPEGCRIDPPVTSTGRRFGSWEMSGIRGITGFGGLGMAGGLSDVNQSNNNQTCEASVLGEMLKGLDQELNPNLIPRSGAAASGASPASPLAQQANMIAAWLGAVGGPHSVAAWNNFQGGIYFDPSLPPGVAGRTTPGGAIRLNASFQAHLDAGTYYGELMTQLTIGHEIGHHIISVYSAQIRRDEYNNSREAYNKDVQNGVGPASTIENALDEFANCLRGA